MKYVDDFFDYVLLDMSNKMKLESWNGIKLLRPDPQIIWSEKQNDEEWENIDAEYIRSNTGGGEWHIKNKDIPTRWTVSYHDLTFNIKLMGFKHTGLFPEQAYNWNYIRKKITIDFDLPNISTILFNSDFIEIIDNKTYFFQFNLYQNNVNFLFLCFYYYL